MPAPSLSSPGWVHLRSFWWMGERLGYIGRSQKAVRQSRRSGRTHRNHRAVRAGVARAPRRGVRRSVLCQYALSGAVQRGRGSPDRHRLLALLPTSWVRGRLETCQASLRQRFSERTGMTTKNDFTEEEWIRVRRAPFVAGMAISLADPGGPIELAKESTASLKSATNPPTREQLLAEIALDVQAMTQQSQNPLSGFKPTNAATAGQQILDELQAVSAIVSSKATADEIPAFGQWLLMTAQAAADAAKEGGFMGFHAIQVSQGEDAMLDQVRTAIDA